MSIISRQELQKLFDGLKEEHKLDGWHLKIGKQKRTLGLTHFGKQEIQVSKYAFTLERKTVIDTLIHEIAHAIVGMEHGHDNVWKTKAKELGGTGNILGPTMKIKTNYKLTCESGKNCSNPWVEERIRKPNSKTFHKLQCKYCKKPLRLYKIK